MNKQSNRFAQKIILFSSALMVFLATTTAHASFDGSQVTATWEIWSGKSPGGGGSLLGVLDNELMSASDSVTPDFANFHSSTGNDFELWDVDFKGNTLTLTYTSIDKRTFDHQYMYMSAVGFHFEDTENKLGKITHVSVDKSYAPFGFNHLLTHFDDNNIWVDLQGSMCHTTSMGSMPSCTNPNSPTGYDNQIVLTVEFEDMEPGMDYARINNLLDWAEDNYSSIFPSQQTSFELLNYYVRFYPETNTYLGTDGVDVYLYDDINGLVNVGNLEGWLNQLGF